ncbi:MAG: NBR1-Ig-like domain-containing protein [Chloroflexota bacterium]|nr:NBR1-Ig-like domain-containing protein [Chloroflexota bacterium]
MNPKRISKFIIILCMLILTGCNLPGRGQVNIAITSPIQGQALVLNQETRVLSLSMATSGIQSVELYVNGQLIHTDTPPAGNPKEYTADQPWIPTQEGNVVISVVAIDTKNNRSDPVSISLQVVPSVSDAGGIATPTLTVTPEGLPQTQTAQVGCTNDATFVQDVTIPINSYLTAGSNFTKIWRVSNSGTCDWIGYQLIHISGELFGTTSPQALPMVNRGNNADITLEMVAPSSPGTYSSVWQIRAEDGTVFGPDLLMTIVVPQLPSLTPSSTATSTATTAPTFTQTITPTQTLTVTPTNTQTQPPLSVEQIQTQIPIAPSSTEHTTVSCPYGSVVVSGGFSAQNGIRVWHFMKDGLGWRIYATNSSSSERILTVKATCLYNSGGTVSQEITQVNINPNGKTNLKANCPSGSVVTGGGWVIGSSNSVRIYNSSQSGNAWQIWVENNTSSTPLVNVYAICLSGVSGSTNQTSPTSVSISGSSTGYAIASCPSGTYTTGGGFALQENLTVYNTSMYQDDWINYARNTSGDNRTMFTYATCYSP